jgi:hypothetical protein
VLVAAHRCVGIIDAYSVGACSIIEFPLAMVAVFAAEGVATRIIDIEMGATNMHVVEENHRRAEGPPKNFPSRIVYTQGSTKDVLLSSGTHWCRGATPSYRSHHRVNF